MKLSGEQRDTLHSLVITQNVAGAILFVEGLDGQALDSVSDQASGGTAQVSGSPAGPEDTGKKARSGGK